MNTAKKLTREEMSKRLVTVRWDEPIADANDKMETYRIRHLPVRDAEGFIIGILSDRDVAKAMNPQRPGFLQGALAGDYMSWPAVTVDEKTPIKTVAEGMVDEKISSFLVTRNGKEVVGIITTEDLLKYLIKSLTREPSTMESLPYNPVIMEALREASAAGI